MDLGPFLCAQLSSKSDLDRQYDRLSAVLWTVCILTKRREIIQSFADTIEDDGQIATSGCKMQCDLKRSHLHLYTVANLGVSRFVTNRELFELQMDLEVVHRPKYLNKSM